MEDLRMDWGGALNREANLAKLSPTELQDKLAEAKRQGAMEACARVEGMLKQLGQEYHDGTLVIRESTDPTWIALARMIIIKLGYETTEEK